MTSTIADQNPLNLPAPCKFRTVCRENCQPYSPAAITPHRKTGRQSGQVITTRGNPRTFPGNTDKLDTLYEHLAVAYFSINELSLTDRYPT